MGLGLGLGLEVHVAHSIVASQPCRCVSHMGAFRRTWRAPDWLGLGLYRVRVRVRIRGCVQAHVAGA